MKAVMPLCRFSGAVMVKSTQTSASGPLVMKFFTPSMT